MCRHAYIFPAQRVREGFAATIREYAENSVRMDYEVFFHDENVDDNSVDNYDSRDIEC